jgi:hypothetical protein
MRSVYLFSLALIVLVTGCSTPYQSDGFTGGYEETQVRENTWTVRFRGNGYTKASRAADFCLLRCAEICYENGYNYFVIVDSTEDSLQASYSTPAQTYTTGYVSGNSFQANSYTYGGQVYHFNKPRTKNTVIGLSDEEGGNINSAYQSEFVISSIRAKYKL